MSALGPGRAHVVLLITSSTLTQVIRAMEAEWAMPKVMTGRIAAGFIHPEAEASTSRQEDLQQNRIQKLGRKY